MTNLETLQQMAADIESDTGVRVVVLTTALLGGYELASNGSSYGPFKPDVARIWLGGFWSGVLASERKRS